MSGPVIGGAAALALAAAFWLLLCLRVRHWRAATIDHLARAQHGLAAGQRTRRVLEQQATLYAADAPSPYGPIARELHQTLQQIRSEYAAAAAGCARLGKRAAVTTANRGRLELLYLGIEWQRWRTGSAQGAALAASISALETAAARAQTQLAALRDMPRTALRRSRELHRLGERIDELAPALYAAGFGGPTLDRAATQARELCARLAELPSWCVPGQEMAPPSATTQDSTAAAWQLLDRLEAPLRAALDQLQGWQTAYEQAGRALVKMRQALRVAGEQLRHLPDPIDAAAEIQLLERLVEQGTALETRYHTPHIEGLASLQARIDDLLRAADALAATAETAARALAYLRQAVPGNTLLLHGLASRMHEAARTLPCPLDWGSRIEPLQQLRRLENEIGAVEARRTPARLKGHADMAAHLAESIEALEREVIETLRLRDEWVALTGRPEMALPLVWLQQARELDREAERYAPLNWPRTIHVPSILRAARDLEAQYRALMPPLPGLPLPVSSLPERLGRLKELMGELEDLGRDLQAANERLAALQAMEREAGQEIERVDQALDDLLEQADQARPPFAAGAARGHRALRQASRQGERHAAGLEGKQRRRVEDQARQVHIWAAATHRDLAAWVDAVRDEIQDAIAGLRQEVSALEPLAPFDREPAMAEARAQLAAGRAPAHRPAGRPSRDLPTLEELAEQGKKLLAARARLHAAREALRTQVGGQIHPQRERLERAQREAQERYEALLELERACRAGWPPLRCDTSAAAQEWERLARERERLRRTGGTVRDVTLDLQRLTGRLAALDQEIRRREDQVKTQQQDLRRQVEQLTDWQERLAAYRRAHRDETAVAEAVDERLREIDNLTRRAQGRYRHGELAFEEARRVLDELWAAARADLPVRGRPSPLSAAEIESRA